MSESSNESPSTSPSSLNAPLSASPLVKISSLPKADSFSTDTTTTTLKSNNPSVFHSQQLISKAAEKIQYSSCQSRPFSMHQPAPAQPAFPPSLSAVPGSPAAAAPVMYLPNSSDPSCYLMWNVPMVQQPHLQTYLANVPPFVQDPSAAAASLGLKSTAGELFQPGVPTQPTAPFYQMVSMNADAAAQVFPQVPMMPEPEDQFPSSWPMAPQTQQQQHQQQQQHLVDVSLVTTSKKGHHLVLLRSQPPTKNVQPPPTLPSLANSLFGYFANPN